MKIFKKVLGAGLVSIISILGVLLYKTNKKAKKDDDIKKRYALYYDVLNQWLKSKNNNHKVEDYFKNNNYNSIAIYGMGEMGNRLFEDLKESDIKVTYFIDNNADSLYQGWGDLPVIGIDEISEQETVDAIIVTPIYAFDQIEEKLIDAGVTSDIISLEDIIYEF